MARALSDSDPAAQARNLKDLLPPGVCVIFSERRHAEAKLHPLEQQLLSARRMQPVREREFRIGRAIAREALARFGIADHPLLPAETREPLWPDGIVGSISHCEGVCAVAVAKSAQLTGLGIDIERVDRIDERIADTVCTPHERRELDAPAAGVPRRRARHRRRPVHRSRHAPGGAENGIPERSFLRGFQPHRHRSLASRRLNVTRAATVPGTLVDFGKSALTPCPTLPCPCWTTHASPSSA